MAQVGHVLGLHHPDDAAAIGRNMEVSPPVGLTDAFDCTRPWDLVHAGAAAPRRSLMNALSPHSSTACVEADDLEALNVLYPTCEGAVHTPLCYRAPQYGGWVRLLLVVAVPITLATLGVLACHYATLRCHQRNRAALRAAHDAQVRSSTMGRGEG